MLSLEELKANLAATAESGDKKNNWLKSNTMPFNKSTSFAILADKNEKNGTGFVQATINHQVMVNGEKTTISCLSQYKDDNGEQIVCPLCIESAKQYEAGDKVKGKQLYKSTKHLVNAMVVQDDSPESAVGTVGVLTLSYQTYNAFNAGVKDLENHFIDPVKGNAFVINKTQSGEFPCYTTSVFARKPLKLTKEQIAQCEEESHSLLDFIPRQPSIESVEGLLNRWKQANGSYTAPTEDGTRQVQEFPNGAGEAVANVMDEIKSRRSNAS